MSALHESLAKYVALRRALGTQLAEPAKTLVQFIDFIEAEGSTFITSSLALRWATKPQGVQRATWARRLGHVRGLAAYLSATDERTEIPPCHLLAPRRTRRTPYIFTAREIGLLMTQAARLRSRSGLRALTYSTLVGLLAATGLRPGEALALDVGDVDLDDGLLAVRETKFGKSRLVPIERSTRAALIRYARRRRELWPSSPTAAFLLSERGRRLRGSAARSTFVRLSQAVGVRAPSKPGRSGRGPRLQDLRHTFATQRLVEWYRAGADVTRRMSALSTYLGHVAVHHTYWYVEAVPELLQLATDRLSAKGGAQ